MVKEFEGIPSLLDLCHLLDKDENNVEDLKFLIGCKHVERKPLIDIMIDAGMIESKTRFRKNPQSFSIDGEKCNINSIPDKDFVLCIGKGSSFKCCYVVIKNQE